MEIILVYLKIFLEKLRALLGSPSRQKMLPAPSPAPAAASPAPAPNYALTSVPDGYSLKLQGTDMCAGEPMHIGHAYEILDDLDEEKVSSQWGDPQSMLMLDRAKKRCDAAEGCKFITIWKDGGYSMYDSNNCTDTKKSLNKTVTLENLHKFSGGRINDQGELEVPPPAPAPPPPKILPSANTPEQCDAYMETFLEPYDSNKNYAEEMGGFSSVSNRVNYCTSMLNRPDIDLGCKQRICEYISGHPKGTVLPGLKPPWKAVEVNGMTYYQNDETGQTTWTKPPHVASGEDHFVMRNFCSEACVNLNLNQTGDTPMADTYGEVIQVPGVAGGNPFFPPNTIFNELPTLTDDDCLDMNTIYEEAFPGAIPTVTWRPTKGKAFNVLGTPEESCGEDPDNRGRGVRRAKKYLGLTENQKACRVEYKKLPNEPCDRECGLRFLMTEIRLDKDYGLKRFMGEMEETEIWNDALFAEFTRSHDSRPTWKIGKKMGVLWGIDTRPGTGERNPDAEGTKYYWEQNGPDAPYGYKIMAEKVKIEHPALGGKTCGITEPGWYRTAKIPIEKDEDINHLLKKWNNGSKWKQKLVNEDDTESVLIVNSATSGYLSKVFSKTRKDAEGGPNW